MSRTSLTKGLVFTLGLAACGSTATRPDGGDDADDVADAAATGGAAGAVPLGGTGGGGRGGSPGGSGGNAGNAGSGGNAGGTGGTGNHDAGSAGGSGGMTPRLDGGVDANRGSDALEAGIKDMAPPVDRVVNPACNSGKAVQFDGDLDDLLLVDIEGDLPIERRSRTVELWAYFSGPKAWRGEHSLFEYGKGKPCHVFGIDVDKWTPTASKLDPYGNGCGSDNTFVTSPMVPETGWLHLAWAYDGDANLFQFTINGVKQKIVSTKATAQWTTTQSEITIGAAAEFGLQGFDGKIDEFRVWNVARTEEDIKRDMNVLLKGNEPGLVAYFHFDDAVADPASTTTFKLADATGKMRNANMPRKAKPTWVESDIPAPFTCPK